MVRATGALTAAACAAWIGVLVAGSVGTSALPSLSPRNASGLAGRPATVRAAFAGDRPVGASRTLVASGHRPSLALDVD